MSTSRSGLLLIFLSVLALAIPSEAAGPSKRPSESSSAQAIEWTFRVTADPATARIRPDPAAPAVAFLAKDSQVKSYAAEGSWVRIIIARQDGSVVIGYVSSTDLESLEIHQNETASFWRTEKDDYYGPGFSLLLSGGYGTIGGGDIPAGAANYYQAMIDQLSVKYKFGGGNPMAFGSRASVDLGLLYHLSARFALGLGGDAAWSRALADTYAMAGERLTSLGVQAIPRLYTVSYRAIASYLLPITKQLALRLSGGPMMVRTQFDYSCSAKLPGIAENFVLSANAFGFGAHASAALELNVNESASLFLEAFSRAARLSGFEGTQKTNKTSTGGWVASGDSTGTLYAVDADAGTLLTILTEAPAASNPYREAVYSLLGVDIRFGFKLRF